jgi:outer membrane protein assembly factor BamE
MTRLALPRPPFRLLLAAPLLLLAAGCDSLQRSDSFLGVITPYRVDIVQGNAVTREQVALIRPGLTRLQVRDVLGSPLLADPFHADRWDYLFTMRRQGTEPQRRSVIVVFDGERVKSVEASNDLPSEREFVASISRYKDPRAPRLELSEDERAALPPPKRREAPAPEPIGPVRSYPPLEGS